MESLERSDMAENRPANVVELPAEEVRVRLRAIGSAIDAAAQWIRTNRERDERNLVVFNLLTAPLAYVFLYVQNLDGPISVLALCTRSLFELNVRVRHVLRSAANMKQWIAEAGEDRLELTKALMGLAEPGDPRMALFEDELRRIEHLKAKHQLPALRKKDTRLEALVRETGQEQEYRALFKLFSKLVHPTSYLINHGTVMDDHQTRTVLLTRFQLYALDLLKRIADEMGVPDELIAFRSSKGTPSW
jgi:hypothetical protein